VATPLHLLRASSVLAILVYQQSGTTLEYANPHLAGNETRQARSVPLSSPPQLSGRRHRAPCIAPYLSGLYDRDPVHPVKRLAAAESPHPVGAAGRIRSPGTIKNSTQFHGVEFFYYSYVYFSFRAGTGGKTHILFLEVDKS